jgi:hypothetical protein
LASKFNDFNILQMIVFHIFKKLDMDKKFFQNYFEVIILFICDLLSLLFFHQYVISFLTMHYLKILGKNNFLLEVFFYNILFFIFFIHMFFPESYSVCLFPCFHFVFYYVIKKYFNISAFYYFFINAINCFMLIKYIQGSFSQPGVTISSFLFFLL